MDGWRGISILCVLAGHMLPLGPKSLQLNETFAARWNRSFFHSLRHLIVSMLARNDSGVISFLIRRLFRIVPLAWTYLIIVLLVNRAPLAAAACNLYSTFDPSAILPGLRQWPEILRSLGVEIAVLRRYCVCRGCGGRLGWPRANLMRTGHNSARLYSAFTPQS